MRENRDSSWRDGQLERDSMDIHDQAVRMWTVEHDHAEAEALFRRALELNPDHTVILCNYATFVRSALRDYDLAERLYQRVVEREPSSALFAAILGGLYVIRNRVSEATHMLGRAWTACTRRDQRAAVLTLLYWCLAKRMQERDDTPGLVRLRLLLQNGIQGPFQFDDFLACASERLPSHEFQLYSILTDAILEQEETRDLRGLGRWSELPSIPASQFWCFGSMVNTKCSPARGLDEAEVIAGGELLECFLGELVDQTPPEPAEILPTGSGSALTATVIAAYSGDRGRAAGMSFAAAMWLVEHAGQFLRAIKAAKSKGQLAATEDEVELSRRICDALTQEIGLPREARTRLISRLLVEIGDSLDTDSEDWEENSIRRFMRYAEKASKIFSGTGYGQHVLPWALEMELVEQELPLEDRVASLREAIPERVRNREISEHELNNWAYLLLLVGRWRAATPMAILATEIARYPRNLDTLGWACFFEGATELAIQTLTEALAKHDLTKEPESWAEVAYHKLCVLLHAGRKSDATQLVHNMIASVPDCYWTQKAKRLDTGTDIEPGKPRERSERGTGCYEYDIALSFAGEDRGYVEKVAGALENYGVRVFYDEFQKAELWGKNLYTHLTDVYLSKRYNQKLWIGESE